LEKSVHMIRPEDVETYQPHLHPNAANRRLLRTGHLEIILGMIGRAGGAQEHAHEKNEPFISMLQGTRRGYILGRSLDQSFASKSNLESISKLKENAYGTSRGIIV
jgi:hypothetical protein